MFDFSGIEALLGLIPIGYIFSLPAYSLLRLMLRKFAGYEENFWTHSIVAFVAMIPTIYFGTMAIGGDASPPSTALALGMVLLSALSFAVLYWLGSIVLGNGLSFKMASITFTYWFLIVFILIFVSRSGS